MPIPVTCPKCGLKSNAPDQAAGKKVRCKCGGSLMVPATKISDTPEKPSSKSGSAKLPSPEPSPSPNLLDLLTDRDQLQAQSNPYAVIEKSSNNDVSALRGYLRDDDAKVTKAKQNQSNLILITASFFLGAIRNIAIAVIAMAFLKQIPDASFVNPLMAVGGAYLAVLIPYVLFDLAAGVGMVLRKPWGWWLAMFGLGWGISERIGSFVVVCMTSEDYVGPLIVGIASLVLCGVSFVLMATLMSKDFQKRFGVEVKPLVVWLLILLIPVVIEGSITAGFYSAVKKTSAPTTP